MEGDAVRSLDRDTALKLFKLVNHGVSRDKSTNNRRAYRGNPRYMKSSVFLRVSLIVRPIKTRTLELYTRQLKNFSKFPTTITQINNVVVKPVMPVLFF